MIDHVLDQDGIDERAGMVGSVSDTGGWPFRPLRPRPAFSKLEIISGRLVELIGPGVNDGLLIEIVHGSHDPILEFLFGRDADVAEDGAGKI